MRHTLQFGIGLHHAGLADSDRKCVEALFVAGKIQVRTRASSLGTLLRCIARLGASSRWHSAGSAAMWNWCMLPLNCWHTFQVLVATSTLAWGVNTPAHLVVIKGTEYFDAPSR